MPTAERRPVDVIVAGGGNAALCAALSARIEGASVLVLERSAQHDRGGNSKHTRNFRCVRSGLNGAPSYTADEMMADLQSVSGTDLDRELARLAIEGSGGAPEWMEAQGVRWQDALRGTVALDRTNRFFLGGGKALLNAYYARAEKLGIEVRYGSRVEDVVLDGRRATGVAVVDGEGRREIHGRAVVVASGGFEANVEWLRRYWGDRADNYVIRGSPSNDGIVLAALLRAGVSERGNARGFHAIAVDARSPRFDGGIVTRVDSIPYGIAVNVHGERFYDEGEDLWPKRYATWGGLIAEQPGQLAFSVFDADAWGRFIPPLYPPHEADTIEGLAAVIGVPPAALRRTVDAFNRAAPRGNGYDTDRLDGSATRGLTPPKSNWARRIERPRFRAYPLRPGITFTYLGVGVDRCARVLKKDGSALENVFAAGEIMAGNILRKGYLAGFGMTIGTVFGRIAGTEAARAAR